MFSIVNPKNSKCRAAKRQSLHQRKMVKRLNKINTYQTPVTHLFEMNKNKKFDMNSFKKCLIIFAYLICFVLFAWEVGIFISHYLSYPLATINTKGEGKLTYYPGIAICNNRHRFPKSIQNKINISEEITRQNLEHAWAQYGIHGEKLECNGYKPFYMGPGLNHTTLNTIFGQCTDITIECPVYLRATRYYVRIYKHEEIEHVVSMPDNVDTYFNVYAHLPDQINIHEIMDNLRAKWSFEIEVEFMFARKEYRYTNSPSKPCIQANERIKCIHQCVVKLFEKNLKCKIPPMNEVNLPFCNKWSDVYEVINKYIDWQYTGAINNCSCIRPCSITEFSLNLEAHRSKNFNASSIAIYFMDTFDDIITEFYSYPLSSLISDLSGIFGFFLGLSLFRMLELFVAMGSKVYGTFVKH